jgi:hypothetical protein
VGLVGGDLEHRDVLRPGPVPWWCWQVEREGGGDSRGGWAADNLCTTGGEGEGLKVMRLWLVLGGCDCLRWMSVQLYPSAGVSVGGELVSGRAGKLFLSERTLAGGPRKPIGSWSPCLTTWWRTLPLAHNPPLALTLHLPAPG